MKRAADIRVLAGRVGVALEWVVAALVVVAGFQLFGDGDRVDPPGGWIALTAGWTIAVVALFAADAATRIAERQGEPVDRVGNGVWMVLAVEGPLVLLAALASVLDSGMS